MAVPERLVQICVFDLPYPAAVEICLELVKLSWILEYAEARIRALMLLLSAFVKSVHIHRCGFRFKQFSACIHVGSWIPTGNVASNLLVFVQNSK